MTNACLAKFSRIYPSGVACIFVDMLNQQLAYMNEVDSRDFYTAVLIAETYMFASITYMTMTDEDMFTYVLDTGTKYAYNANMYRRYNTANNWWNL